MNRKIKIIVFLSVLAVIVFTFSLFLAPDTKQYIFSNPTTLAENLHSADLPIDNITLHKTPDAWGTVIYIPQTHRNPGTAVHDQINDSAEVAQEQIYKVISHLAKKMGIRFIMVEGDLYGKVSEQKIVHIRKKIDTRNQLASLAERYALLLQNESLDPVLEDKILQSLDTVIAKADREIILQGAPHKLKAETEDLTLYGAENKSTFKESAALVRDYVYLKDRMKELQVPRNGFLTQRTNRGLRPSASFSVNELREILTQLRNSNNSLISDIDSLKSLADTKNRNDLSAMLTALKKGLQNLQTSSKSTAAINRGMDDFYSDAPSRENNPYKSVNDPRKINSLISDAEKRIEETVIEKRDKETAQNITTGLITQQQTIGILQFGAGHQEGLVPELQKQGLSVIVITVPKVGEKRADLG